MTDVWGMSAGGSDDPPLQSNNGSKLSENPYYNPDDLPKTLEEMNAKYAGIEFSGESAFNLYTEYRDAVESGYKKEMQKKKNRISKLQNKIKDRKAKLNRDQSKID